MSRPSRIRLIAAELRDILGPDIPFRDLVRMAAIILKAHDEPEKLELDAGYVRATMVSMELDLALGDGGWRILEFERRLGMRFDDER
jgi:hypothetical protein